MRQGRLHFIIVADQADMREVCARRAPLRCLPYIIPARHGADQDFLRDVVYPYANAKAEIHDELFSYNEDAKKFPIGRGPNHEYVGRIICHSPNAFRLLGESHRELPRDRIEAYRHA